LIGKQLEASEGFNSKIEHFCLYC